MSVTQVLKANTSLLDGDGRSPLPNRVYFGNMTDRDVHFTVQVRYNHKGKELYLFLVEPGDEV